MTRHDDCAATKLETGRADQRGAGQKNTGRGRERCARERNGAESHRYQDEPAVLDEIAERHDEQEAEAISDLRHRHDEAGSSRGEAKGLGDLRDQRLPVIDVGDQKAAGGGERQDGAGRYIGRPRRFADHRRRRRFSDGLCNVHPIHRKPPFSNTIALP
jgi:hypothetical protein